MDSIRFIADVHLAKVAKYMRLLGFDTLYFNQIDDSTLLQIAAKEKRYILTKDRGLAQRSDRVYLVKEKEIKGQIYEILRHFAVKQCEPFTRCLVDNAFLQPVSKEEIIDRLPQKVIGWCNKFWICPVCGRIYWHGTHFLRMKKFIDEVCGEIQARALVKE
ncbi:MULTISPECIES: Mut7-C RNAse domain-containing protein [unclassified Nitratiruptor]|uniref:Mut7-C RNAse domain-containing protein n=1 Tax=unclassified Nitratiruptor TaxID=2624044 RepID=UPI0019169B71|nr:MULTISPECIES: Mut7-C RNAse domain-containing protein [unclassified Nitratiruptor]